MDIMAKKFMDKQEKTMIIALILSMWGPIITGIAVTMNESTTQLADFVRRTVEFLVLVVSWQFYRYINTHQINIAKRFKLERFVKRAIALTMLISGVFLLLISIDKMINPVNPTGQIYLGLTIASLGFLVNGFLWRKYVHFNKQTPNTIIHAQVNLYQVKTIMDIFVIIALLSIPLFSYSKTSYWIDLVGTLFIIIYMIYTSYITFTKTQFVDHQTT
jgi:divalent metal cation (Fe/Co/Zn/Cd) transporter